MAWSEATTNFVFRTIEGQLDVNGLQALEKAASSRIAPSVKALTVETALDPWSCSVPSEERVDGPSEEFILRYRDPEVFGRILDGFINLRSIRIRLRQHPEEGYHQCLKILLGGLNRSRLTTLEKFSVELGQQLRPLVIFDEMVYEAEQEGQMFSKEGSFAYRIKSFNVICDGIGPATNAHRQWPGPLELSVWFPNLISLDLSPMLDQSFHNCYWNTFSHQTITSRAVCQLETLTLRNFQPWSDYLCAFIQANAPTLREIHLEGIALVSGSWSSIFLEMAQIPQLHTFHTRNCIQDNRWMDKRYTKNILNRGEGLDGVVSSPRWGDHHALGELYTLVRKNRAAAKMPIGSDCCDRHQAEECYVEKMASVWDYSHHPNFKSRREEDANSSWLMWSGGMRAITDYRVLATFMKTD